MDRISEIVERKQPCYFISPHLDDAILSAGGMISYLSDKIDVTVVTLFTEASGPPNSRFCRGFWKTCGHADPFKFFSDRKREDIRALRSIHVKHVHMGFVDAAWRKKQKPRGIEKFIGRWIPEALHRYPFEWNFRSGRVHREDEQLVRHLCRSLRALIPHKKRIAVFCPLAIGNHVDHVITRDVCTLVFRNPIFWSDVPYEQWSRTPSEFILKHRLHSFSWDTMIEKKRDLIFEYRTQAKFLFPEGDVPMFPETFYLE